LPLALDVAATPTVERVGAPTLLVARLRNPTDTPQVVNRRMLLNHIGGPGEMWLEVNGPEGYRNRRGFRVNAGPAPSEFFVTLGPGEWAEQSWELEKYATSDIQGHYDLTLTYHNENERPTAAPCLWARSAA
jgi:hypothetical protein